MSSNDQKLWHMPGVIIALITSTCGCTEPRKVTSAEPAAPHLQLDGVFRLETEWYPAGAEGHDATENVLLRELVRQAVLIAARDELGLVTRDESLGEPFSCSAKEAQLEGGAAENTVPPAETLDLRLDVDSDGDWQARLLAPGGPKFAPIWIHKSKLNFDPPTIYAQLAPQLDELSSSIAESLRRAGVEGKPKTGSDDTLPSPDIEKQLSEMNFISQYSAVRAAHHAINQKGSSPAWLGVLVRGYANLALLTRHHWSSHQAVFSSRSLLYAERLLRTSQDKANARWHRAYARALVGTHVPAFEDVAALVKKENEADSPAPPWSKLLSPYLEFDADQLSKVAGENPELKELAGALRWEGEGGV